MQQKTGEYLQNRFSRDAILEEFFIPGGGKLSVDFFLPKRGLVIEVQGEGHIEHTPFFHGNKNLCKFAQQIRRDERKYNWAQINNFNFIEIFTEKDLEKI